MNWSCSFLRWRIHRAGSNGVPFWPAVIVAELSGE